MNAANVYLLSINNYQDDFISFSFVYRSLYIIFCEIIIYVFEDYWIIRLLEDYIIIDVIIILMIEYFSVLFNLLLMFVYLFFQ